MFHDNPAAMLLTQLDGRMLDANAHFVETSGYQRDELIGRFARDAGMIGAPLLATLAQPGRLPATEIEITRRDGTRRTVLASTETVSLHGEPCRLSVFTDITERKRLERRLALQNEISRELLEGDDLAAIAPRILKRLCRADGWSAAMLWLTNGDGPRTCLAVTCQPGGAGERLEIPIVCRGETYGALEVVCSTPRTIDDGTSEVLESIAHIIGLYLALPRAS